jgi:hypothetical protein
MAAKGQTIKIVTDNSGNIVKYACIVVIAFLVIWFLWHLWNDKRKKGKNSLFGSLLGHGSSKTGSDSKDGNADYEGADAVNNNPQLYDLTGSNNGNAAQQAAGAAEASGSNFYVGNDGTLHGSGDSKSNGSQSGSYYAIFPRPDFPGEYQYRDSHGVFWYGDFDTLSNIAADDN